MAKTWAGFEKDEKTGKAGWLDNFERWSQSMWEDVTGKTAREAGKEAAKQAEIARRQAIIKQFGEKQQADGIAMANMRMNQSGKDQKNNAGPVSSKEAPGFIGAGLNSTSGTF